VEQAIGAREKSTVGNHNVASCNSLWTPDRVEDEMGNSDLRGQALVSTLNGIDISASLDDSVRFVQWP
jgi:hypothetical protein